jgi:hypothetical protein
MVCPHSLCSVSQGKVLYICHLLFYAGIRWYDYDPTKLLIELSYFLGLAYDLKHPPENEIQKARFQVSNAIEGADYIELRGARAGIVSRGGPHAGGLRFPLRASPQVQEGKLTSLKQSIAWPDPEAVTNEITMEQYKNAKKEGQIWVAYQGRYGNSPCLISCLCRPLYGRCMLCGGWQCADGGPPHALQGV